MKDWAPLQSPGTVPAQDSALVQSPANETGKKAELHTRELSYTSLVESSTPTYLIRYQLVDPASMHMKFLPSCFSQHRLRSDFHKATDFEAVSDAW